ncbi:MAG: TIM barrel protein [Fimbriimonadaceae bacterium]|nr:TIM barrel protein [Fimbriimonadaceae bacterium]
MEPISIASFSFHGALAAGTIDLFGYLEACRYRYHLNTADIWNGLMDSTDDGYVAKVKEGLESRGLVLANYHADGCHVWDDDPKVRATNRDKCLRELEIATRLGAKTFRVDTGGTVAKATDEQMAELVARYGEYVKIGKDAGMRVGPESHWGLSLISDNMAALAEAVNSPFYGFLLHLHHWEDGDEPGGDRKMAKYAMHTHVDYRVTTECLEPAMKTLKDAGYAGCWGVEHHTGKHEYENVAFQLACVRRVLAGWR